MTIDLKGHAALVTGASRGVGRAIVEAFAEAGAHVVVNSRRFSEETQSLLDKCKSFGVTASFVPGDLAGPKEKVVDDVFQSAVAARPDIDILVNNAGQYFDVPFLEMDYERLFKTFRLNVASGYFLTQRFARRWVASQTAGRVLFIGSINGKLAEQVSTAYDTSKGALEMMVKTLAVALAPLNIRVNGLAPGIVRTPQTSWLDTQPAKAAWIAHHTPNGRIPDAAVCGPGAVYLVSDAASHVHGHMLMIDGGMSAWQQPEPM